MIYETHIEAEKVFDSYKDVLDIILDLIKSYRDNHIYRIIHTEDKKRVYLHTFEFHDTHTSCVCYEFRYEE